MKKHALISILTIAILLGISTASVRGADLKNPKEIIKKSQAYVLSLDSYTVKVHGEGWDFNPDASAKRQSAAAGDAAKNFKSVASVANDVKKKADTADTDKLIYKKYEFYYKFKKPYLLQMNLIMSDYVPKIIYGSVLTYRPDQDPNVFYFKPKISPIGIKRDINSESGDLLYRVIIQNNAAMNTMSLDVKPALKGTAKFNGRDVYVIEFKFPKGKKFKSHPVDYKIYDIPAIARKQFAADANGYTDGKSGRFVYYIDKENFLVLARDNYDFDGKRKDRQEWTEFKVNTLSERDF